MLPFIKGNASYRVNIPKITGVNYRDSVTLVHDNQSTDELNMWGRDGVLTTRPAIDVKGVESFEYPMNDNYSIVARTTNDIVIINGKKYVLEYEIHKKNDYLDEDLQSVRLRLRASASDYIDLGKIQIGDANSGGVYYIKMNVLPVIDNGDVYVYVFAEHSEYAPANIYEVWKIARKGNSYEAPTKVKDDIYAPIVLTNCVSANRTDGNFEEYEKPLPFSTQLEGFNLIGDYYRIQYSLFDNTDGASRPTIENESVLVEDRNASFMLYALPYTPKELSSLANKTFTITLEYTNTKGMFKHTVGLPFDENDNKVEGTVGADGFYLHAYYNPNSQVCYVCLNSFSGANETSAGIAFKNDNANNNMTITAPTYNPNENREKVFKMTRAIWYGNTSLGLSGGNRLFLGANLNETDKSLLVWSDLKNPLYFSENNYNYVGDKSQAITGFGKQGSSLVIFKESETYATQYTTNSIGAEDVVNQSIIDTAANSAIFPMTLINSQIGCNCPDTVQLCRNRLVWADKNGKIYTLTAQNQYSERNIYEVGEMVYAETSKHNLLNAQSADWEDHYLLFVGNKVFVMDYNSYGYTNVASYTKNDDANILIPWHIWELPTKVSRVTNAEGLTLTRVTEDNGGFWYIDDMDMCFNHNDNYYSALPVVKTESPIPCFVQTKLFDFGYPEKYKTIKHVGISFGDNGGTPIVIESVSDTAEDDQTIVTLLGDDSNTSRVRRMQCKDIIPFTKFSARYGLKIACEGYMVIESITITYKTVGGIK